MSALRAFPVVLLLALITLSAQPARAHRFGVILLAPLSGPQADAGKAFIDGFALATREQDRHAFEESDGHLGGLDSYLYKLDSQFEPEQIAQNLKRLISKEHPAFLSAIPAPKSMQQTIEVTSARDIVVVQPEQSKMWKSAQTTPGRLTMIDGTFFSGTFERVYKYAPNTAASRGYIAARLISMAVRSLNQNPAQDLSATRSALHEAQNSLPE